jgi:hypothetical protein
MSAISTVLTACPVDQGSINEYWQDGNLPGVAEQMPHAEFITSPINRRGIALRMTPGNGKVRDVQVTYMPRLLESSADTNVANPYCSTGTVLGDRSTTYTLDTTVNIASDAHGFSATDVEDACRNNANYLMDVAMRQIDQVDRARATSIADQSAALFGTWGTAGSLFTTGNAVGNVNGSSEFVTQTLLSGGNALFPLGWQTLFNGLNEIGFQNAAIFAGRTLTNFFQASLTGCCADSGIDLSRQLEEYGFAVAYDRRIVASSALNSQNKAIALLPGAQQFINYTRSTWKAGMNIDMGANYYHATVVSPRLGIEYDWTLTDTCGTIVSRVVSTGKVIAMPSNMFITGDIYAGVNGAAKILVSNP